MRVHTYTLSVYIYFSYSIDYFTNFVKCFEKLRDLRVMYFLTFYEFKLFVKKKKIIMLNYICKIIFQILNEFIKRCKSKMAYNILYKFLPYNIIFVCTYKIFLGFI